MSGMAHSDHLKRLDPRLQVLLDAEVAAGNVVASTIEWPYEYVEILVCVRERFKTEPAQLPEGVKLEVNPDHWIGRPLDYGCKVPTPHEAEPGRDYWHVLRGPAECG